MRLFSLILLSTLFCANVTVNVDRNQINEGDSVTLTVMAQNTDDAPIVDLPSLADFKIISGPSQSSSSNYQFINGKMSSSSTYTLTWMLLPLKVGRLKIPQFDISVDGKIQKSKPIYVGVSKRNTSSLKDAKFFIEVDVDNESPYRGEQIILTYTLYTRVDVTGFDNELPRFKGFWVEDLHSPTNLKLKRVQKHGKQFNAATIKKVALFPTKSGELVIEPMVATIAVRERRRNDFSLFGSPSKQYTLSTQRKIINVKPLPPSSDKSISANVGNWKLSSTIDTRKPIENEAITIKVNIKGNGNLKSVDILPYTFPNGFEVFEPKISMKESKSQNIIGGTKSIEYVIIPRESGTFTLPPFKLKYFNPHSKKWITKETKPFNLSVTEGKNNFNENIGFSKEEVQVVGKDIRFMDEAYPRWQKLNSGLFDKWTYFLFILAITTFLIPTMVSARQSHLVNTAGSRKSKAALKHALKSITIDVKTTSPEEIYSELNRILIQYVNDKTGNRNVEYSIAELTDILNVHIDNDKILDELEKLLKRGESVRFAPVSSANISHDVNRFESLLKEVDNEWS